MASYSYCGNFPVRSDSDLPKTTSVITNVTILIGDVSVEQSHVIPYGTKKIMIKHRESGTIDFSFVAGLANYIEVPKGTSYSENDLNIQNETLYYRTDKVGTIEILTWS